MKISGQVQVSTTPEPGDLSKQRINYSDPFVEVDANNSIKSQYSIDLLAADTAIELIPSQITRARLVHIKARFPDAALIRTMGFKLKEGSGGTIDPDYKSCKELLLYGVADIYSLLVENDELQVRKLLLESSTWLTLTPDHIGTNVTYTGGTPTDTGEVLAYDNATYEIWVKTADAFANTTTVLLVDGDSSDDLEDSGGSVLAGQDAKLDVIIIGE